MLGVLDTNLLENYKALSLFAPPRLLPASLICSTSSCFKNPSFGLTARLARTASSAWSFIDLWFDIIYLFNLGKIHVMLGDELSQDTGGWPGQPHVAVHQHQPPTGHCWVDKVCGPQPVIPVLCCLYVLFQKLKQLDFHWIKYLATLHTIFRVWLLNPFCQCILHMTGCKVYFTPADGYYKWDNVSFGNWCFQPNLMQSIFLFI